MTSVKLVHSQAPWAIRRVTRVRVDTCASRAHLRRSRALVVRTRIRASLPASATSPTSQRIASSAQRGRRALWVLTSPDRASQALMALRLPNRLARCVQQASSRQTLATLPAKTVLPDTYASRAAVHRSRARVVRTLTKRCWQLLDFSPISLPNASSVLLAPRAPSARQRPLRACLAQSRPPPFRRRARSAKPANTSAFTAKPLASIVSRASFAGVVPPHPSHARAALPPM